MLNWVSINHEYVIFIIVSCDKLYIDKYCIIMIYYIYDSVSNFNNSVESRRR